jgi:hypothetical protein
MVTLNDLAADLVLAGMGVAGQDLFVAQFPKEPSDVISLHNPTNAQPVRAMAKTTDHEMNVVQVMVRSVGYDAGYNRIRAIYVRWDKFSGMINGTRYIGILAQGDPFLIGVDENKRWRWTCSFNVRRAV